MVPSVDTLFMTIINPNLPANLFIQPTSQPLSTSDLRQLDLRLEQVVRATVVESGLDRTILEMNHQQYRAEADRELQVGQQLRLQVLQLQPQLEFRVLNDPLNDRLATLLPLLTRSYDWGQLIEQVRHAVPKNFHSVALGQVLHQLQQLLSPEGGPGAAANASLASIVGQLQQLMPASEEFLPQYSGSELIRMKNPYQGSVSELSGRTLESPFVELTQKLQTQMAILADKRVDVSFRSWLGQTRSLLAPLQRDSGFLALVSPVPKQALFDVLVNLRDHPKVPPQFVAEVERILVQMERQGVKEFTPAQKVPGQSAGQVMVDDLPKNGRELGSSVQQAGGVDGGRHETNSVKLNAEVQNLLKNIQQLQEQRSSLPPELLGKLEGLSTRLQLLLQNTVNAQVAIPGLETIISQIAPLLSQQTNPPAGEPLGILSQLFGLYLETELLQGKAKDALASLKLALLSLKKELGDEVSEPLRRVELFQLCKARLGEEDVHFLPLPFNELEEGYLLAEKQEETQADAEEESLNLSLSLRLSALGNVRVDMVYGEHGLQLCIAGENQEKKNYLQSAREELETAVTTVDLREISFVADAQLPAKQLQERLLPQARSMLDARI